MKTKRKRWAVVARGASEWAEIMGAWRGSGQGTGAFCRAHGLTIKTFQWWRWALATGRQVVSGPVRRKRSTVVCSASRAVATRPSSSTTAFVEVVPRVVLEPPSPRGSGVEVLIERGHTRRRVRLDADFDVTTLRRVVQALEEV